LTPLSWIPHLRLNCCGIPVFRRTSSCPWYITRSCSHSSHPL
jgi:hypothetical protein